MPRYRFRFSTGGTEKAWKEKPSDTIQASPKYQQGVREATIFTQMHWKQQSKEACGDAIDSRIKTVQKFTIFHSC